MLRPWRQDAADRALVVRAATEPDIARYSTVGAATTPGAADEWLVARSAPDRCDWVMERGSAPVGRVSLARVDQERRTAEIGYWVLPEHRRKGYARGGASAAIDDAIGRLGLTRLRIEHEPANKASCSLATALDFGGCSPANEPVVVPGTPLHLWVHARSFERP